MQQRKTRNKAEICNDSLDILGITVSVSTAKEYTNISIKRFLKDAYDGYIVFRGNLPEYLPEEKEKEAWEHLANEIQIYLSELPPFAIRQYMLDRIVDNTFFEFDFTAYKYQNGAQKYHELIDDIVTIKTIYETQSLYFVPDRAEVIEELLKKHFIGKTAYYKYLRRFRSSQLSALLREEEYAPRTICPLAEDYICQAVFDDLDLNREMLFEELQQVAKEIKGDVCLRCPHNEKSRKHLEVKQKIEEKYPLFEFKICKHAEGEMQIPESRTTLCRYINHMDESTRFLARVNTSYQKGKRLSQQDELLECYKTTFYEKEEEHIEKAKRTASKSGYYSWEAKYGKKVARNKPARVNEIVFADHSQLNVWLLAGYDREDNPVLMRPWVTCLLDYASGAIIGSVVSFSINKHNIAECICRAATITIDSPFYGLPKILYVDRGKDFCSTYLLKGRKGKITKETRQEYPNRAIFSEGLLCMLGVSVRHAKPHSPWTKPIERTFWTLNRRFLKRVPGFCGNKKKRLYADVIENEKRRLLKNNQLWNIEQFSSYWFDCIVPGFNNLKTRDSNSPLERYFNLPRAETLTPSWSCMAGMLQEKQKVKVTDQGFYYKKNLYDDMVLDSYIGKKILVYDFASYATKCVYAMYVDEETGESKFIGEIPLKERIEVVDEHRVRLARNLVVKNIQKNKIYQRIEAVHYLNDYMKLARMPYDAYDMVTREVTKTLYAEKVEEKKNPMSSHPLTKQGLEIAEAKLHEEMKLIHQEMESVIHL